jgi:2-hydroxychromene-2-carboxylate isomerase
VSAPQFFFGAMSPYSWFSAERIEQILPQARWRGVLAGAVFKANERVSWGLTDARERGIADCEARAAVLGLGPMRWPDPWPTSDLHVARAMAYADMRGMLREYSLAAMRLCFCDGRDLGERDSALAAAGRVGIDCDDLAAALHSQDVKEALRATTEQALSLGVFGVPTVVVGDELFWGDDRLEDAAAAQRSLEA